AVTPHEGERTCRFAAAPCPTMPVGMELRWRRRWRDYRTEQGRSPVREFIRALPLDHQAAIVAEMGAVSAEGLAAARHLQDEIYEVRASAGEVQYRVLFAQEGHRSQILLSLEAPANTDVDISLVI